VPFAWFTADEVHGQAKYLRAWLEERGMCHVMAIRRTDTFPTAEGEQWAGARIAALPVGSGSGCLPATERGGEVQTSTAAKYSNPSVQTGTGRHLQGHWHGCDQPRSRCDERVSCFYG
jgi:hypothetical protein